VKNVLEHMVSKAKSDAKISRIGLYLALASLCFFPFIVFTFYVLLVLLLFTTTMHRRYFLLLCSLLLPLLLVYILYMWTPFPNAILDVYFLKSWINPMPGILTNRSIYTLSILLLLLFLLSSFRILTRGRFKNYQSALLQSFALYFGFAIVLSLLIGNRTSHLWWLFVPALTVFLTQYFILAKRILINNILLLLIMAIVYISGVQSQFGSWMHERPARLPEASELEADLAGSDKKVLILSAYPFAHPLVRHGSGFVELPLLRDIYSSRPITTRQQFRFIYLLTKDLPDVIIDPDHLLEELTVDMPYFHELYRTETRYQTPRFELTQFPDRPE